MEAQRSGVHYFYFGHNIWHKHRGIVTAGVLLSPDPAAPAKVAFSFCSPKDQFRRRDSPSTEVKRVRIPDPDHDGRYVTKSVRIPATRIHRGGCDIVDERLGLTHGRSADPNAGNNVDFYEVPVKLVNGKPSAMQAAIDAYALVPFGKLPRLWKTRKLTRATKNLLLVANATDGYDLLNAIYACEGGYGLPMLGFVPA